MKNTVHIHGIGQVAEGSGLTTVDKGGDGRFCAGVNGVKSIASPTDSKVEFIAFDDYTLAYVKSEMGYPAIYPLPPAHIERPVKAVLMDLDGTSVRSEAFWVWIIEKTTAQLLNKPDFHLNKEDEPFVSGHSVSEHLKYCINKYCPDKTVEEARQIYFDTVRYEMRRITAGRGWQDVFVPSPGLGEFLTALKSRGIKIGLVTSGLHEKAWPGILSAFRKLGMGNPKEFYDAIITAGFALGKGKIGTLGELEPKPHPWLYAEVARVGLGIEFKDRGSVIGIEDSGAGVISIRLAGFAAIGISGGNIEQSGTKCLLHSYCNSFDEILKIIDGKE
jgi:beta-phosphoglucomutase